MPTDAKHNFNFIAHSIAVLSVILLISSASVLPSRLSLLSGDILREELLDNKEISDSELDELALSREKAIKWKPMGESLDDLAVVNFEKAIRKNLSTPDASRYIKKTMDFQKRALARAPANTYGWALLSYLYYITEGISENSAKALQYSIETDPFEPSLMLSRLDMAVTLMTKLDKDMQDRLPAMMRNTWKLYPYATAKAAQKNHYVEMLDAALAGDAEQSAKLESILKKKQIKQQTNSHKTGG